MTDFVYALQNEDYWTPRACREWPADKQPRIWFSIPSAASAQEYRLHIATIKEECGMESDDLNAFFAQPAVRELWVKTCKQHITRIERFRKAGEGVDYDWEQMRDEARDQFLQSLGGSGTERFWALYDLTACIQSGMSEEEKKIERYLTLRFGADDSRCHCVVCSGSFDIDAELRFRAVRELKHPWDCDCTECDELMYRLRATEFRPSQLRKRAQNCLLSEVETPRVAYWADFYINCIRTEYVNPLEMSVAVYEVAQIGNRVFAVEEAKRLRALRGK